MEILRDSKPKARKEHKCDFCGLVIKVGETYQNQTNVSDGDLYTWKSHLSCGEISNELNMYDKVDSEGLNGDDFCEFIKEEYCNLMSTTQNEIYEAKGFVYPSFADQLDFVKKHHL